MVARSNEDGEEACMCVNVEKLRSSGNSKKINSNRSTSDDEAIYSAACHAQHNDGQIYIKVGKLNGRPVKVLRDTRCTGMVVDRARLDGDTRQFRLAADGRPHSDRCAISQCLPGYKGQCKVMLSCSLHVYLVIIGNVGGARHMLPDPDWKAEDQKEA